VKLALPKPDREQRPAEALTPEDLAAALKLLAAEEQPPARFRMVRELRECFLAYTLLLATPIGLVIVWFDVWWGLGLMGAGAVSFVLLAFLPQSGAYTEAKQMRKTLEGTPVVKAANALWESSSTLMYLAFWPIVAAALGGCAWLVYGLVVNRALEPLSLVPLGAAGILLCIWVAVDNVRELKYFSRVAGIRGRLEDLVEAGGSPEVTVSGADLDVLEKAETRQTRRVVHEASEQLPDVGEQYAVSFAPTAREDLEQLAVARPSDWLDIQTAIFSLQDDPRPRSAVEVPDGFEVMVGPQGIDFVVDDTSKRVYVLGIRGAKGQGSDDS
jgi:hypothetical protein